MSQLVQMVLTNSELRALRNFAENKTTALSEAQQRVIVRTILLTYLPAEEKVAALLKK